MLTRRAVSKSPEDTSFLRSRSHISTMYDDNSDRKTLDELVNKLFSPKMKSENKSSATLSPSSAKYKQLSMSKFCVKSKTDKPSQEEIIRNTPSHNSSLKKASQTHVKKDNRKRKVSDGKVTKRTKGNSDLKLPTINRWIKKRDPETCTVNNTMRKELKTSDRKVPVKEKKKEFKRTTSGSFDKYGITTPSVEEILEYQKNLKSQQKCIDNFEAQYEPQECVDFSIEEPKTLVMLDCKHLTNEEINKAFDENYQYVYDIFNGVRHSVRHERFKKENLQDQFTSKDLKYNTSTITFTDEQKQLLLSLLDKKFNQDEILCSNTTRYFFKVLLPELCTKIFMDVHNMTFEEATKYLDNRPVRQRP